LEDIAEKLRITLLKSANIVDDGFRTLSLVVGGRQQSSEDRVVRELECLLSLCCWG
jgi:hypothetical protein